MLIKNSSETLNCFIVLFFQYFEMSVADCAYYFFCEIMKSTI